MRGKRGPRGLIRSHEKDYSGSATSAKSPSSAPGPGVVPVLSLLKHGDPVRTDDLEQPLQTLADFTAWQAINNASLEWGDASDGDVVFDGSTAHAGFATLSGSKYTLTRPVYADTLTYSVEVKRAGFPIYARKLVPLAGGKITANGTSAVNDTGGVGAPGAWLGAGADGPDGATFGAGSNGNNETDSLGGPGGNSGYTISPQTGGTVTAPGVSAGSRRAGPVPAGHIVGANAVTQLKGGGSGGSGSGGGLGCIGGGGGGAGGVGFVAAAVIDLTNADLSDGLLDPNISSAAFQAVGGNGGHPSGSSPAGAGGGGGGGYFEVRFGRLIGNGTHALSAYVNVHGGSGSTSSGGWNPSISGSPGQFYGRQM